MKLTEEEIQKYSEFMMIEHSAKELIQKCSVFMMIEHSAKELMAMLEPISDIELLGKSNYVEWLTSLASNAKYHKEYFLNKLGERDGYHNN